MTALCAVEGCTRLSQTRGWCGSHYMRWLRHGDAGGPRFTLTDLERFMSHVDTSAGDDACHPWTGYLRSGYGSFRVRNRMVIATRWILGHFIGRSLQPDEEACHHCDNSACCNPGHLYVGSHATNMRDAVERGRMRNPTAEIKRAQTECIHGHPFSKENTAYRRADGCRVCKACRREWAAARNKRSRLARSS